MKAFLAFLRRMLMDQRGEAGADIDGDQDGDDQDVDVELDDEDEDEEEDEDENDDDEDEEEDDGDDLDKKRDQLTQEIEELEKKAAYWRQEKEKQRGIFFASQKDSRKKEGDDEEVEFTDAQLLGMLEQHKDDSTIMLQIMKHIGQQAAKKGKNEAVDAAAVASTKKEIDSFINQNWPEINEDGSDLRRDVEEAKKMLRLEDHPFSDYLGIAAAVMANVPDMIKEAEERGKKGGIKDKNEVNRKQAIKDKRLSEKGKKKGEKVTLPAQAAQTAKQLGLNDRQAKLYSKLLNAGKKPVTAEV